MKKELVPAFVEKINANIGVVKNVLSENLGITTDLSIEQHTYGHSGDEVFVSIKETGSETKRQLTATPLLRQMFKEASIDIRCCPDDDGRTGYFNVHIRYEHSYNGGGNGLELIGFSIEFATGEVTVY